MLTFLALLQMLAPLVHAHAGLDSQLLWDNGSGKLHIPGLEAYDSRDGALLFEPASHHYSAEGIIIGVDAGIKQTQAKLFNDFGSNYFLPQQTEAFRPLFSPYDTNLPPQVPVYAGRQFIASHTPRAPPSLNTRSVRDSQDAVSVDLVNLAK